MTSCLTVASAYVDVSLSLNDHFLQFSHMAALSRSSHSFFKIIWLAYVWVIWKERNNRVFINKAPDRYTILNKVKLNSFFWLKAHLFTFAFEYHDWR